MAAYTQRWQGGHGVADAAPPIQQGKDRIPMDINTSENVLSGWVQMPFVLWTDGRVQPGTRYSWTISSLSAWVAPATLTISN